MPRRLASSKATSGVQMMSSMLWGSGCCIVELGLGDAVAVAGHGVVAV
jgi:hypothetical protein